MIRYGLRRLLEALPTLWLLATLVFFTLRFAPGGPFDTDRALPPEIMANINARYGLDQPISSQYLHFLNSICHGQLNESFQYMGRSVAEIITQTLPTSFILGLLSLAIAVPLGMTLGSLAAWKQRSFWDWSAVFFSIAGVSLPTYLIASLLVLVFSLKLGWLPPALLESPAGWVLPVVTLALRPLAMIARLTRASMIEALQSDFVRTALGKGLSSRQVVFKHALRNSLIPVVTLIGPIAAQLVTGSFLVEVVFQIPGLGKYFVSAVINRDYPLVMGVTLVYGVILIASNLVVDLLYAWVDPRIRESRA